MNTKMLVVLLGGLVLVSGCVQTVNDRHTFAVLPGTDKFESRYERSVDQVYAASLEVMKANGIVSRESVINPGANAVKAIEAKINGRNVWVRVQAVDAKVTSVTVQVRTPGGGTDINLTQQMQTQIGIRLAAG
jgi:aconitase A